jgi:hypothetical protein
MYLYGWRVEDLGLKTFDIMSVLYILALCYVVFEQNNEDFEIFMYVGKYKPVYARAGPLKLYTKFIWVHGFHLLGYP